MRLRTSAIRSGAVLVVLATVVAGCSGSEGSAGGATGDKSSTLSSIPASDLEDLTGLGATTVVAKDNSFVPQFITVSPGTKITFDNKGRAAHNVIPVDDGAFDKITTEELQPGDTDVLVLDEPGEYPYYCSLHGTPDRGMYGRIIVTDG